MELKNKIFQGNSLEILKTFPDNSIDMCVTSPPYFGLRDYGHEEQIGLEENPEEFIENLVNVFREVKRVLKKEGTLWVNIGDSYAVEKKTNPIGIKPKDLIGIPWMLAFALRSDGWILRQDIIWSKPNPMPESVTDRCTKSHEYIFLLSKNKKYYYDYEQIMEKANYDGRKDTRSKGSHKYSQDVTGLRPQTFAARGHERWIKIGGEYMKNKRSVWSVSTKFF